MAAYLEGGLWLDLAARANRAGARLWRGDCWHCRVARSMHPAEANVIFARWPRAGHRRARAAGARYYLMPHGQSPDGPDEEPLGARLVTSWSTDAADVDRFLALIAG